MKDHSNNLYSIGFDSIQQLMKNNKLKKLTKKELCSVIFCVYKVDMKENKHKKGEYLNFLEKEKAKNIEHLNIFKNCNAN